MAVIKTPSVGGTPNPRHEKRGTFSGKYSWEFKLDCVNKHKNGEHIPTPGKSKKQRDSFMNHVRAWAKAYEDLGIDGLKHSPSNKEWTPEVKLGLVAEVLAGSSIASVAKDDHINPGQLFRWARRYDERGVCGLLCRKGRPSMKKKTKKSGAPVSESEELRLLRERNEYLGMENEYLKNSTPWSPRGRSRKPRRKSEGDQRIAVHP